MEEGSKYQHFETVRDKAETFFATENFWRFYGFLKCCILLV